jgi:chromate reductase
MYTKLLGLSGSLRKGSHNTALLRFAATVLPDHAELELYDYREVPLYDEDLDGAEPPGAVIHLRQAIQGADGLVIATPEYNHGIPGVLKNAIDWASRPAFESSLTKKPVAVLTASKSPVGGARAQSVLRQVLGGTLSPIFPHVEMLIGTVHEQFDALGNLEDAKTRQRLQSYLARFVEWIQKQ